MNPEIVELGKGITEDDLLFHDEQATEPSLAYLLSRMRHPEFPEPIGVFRAVDRPMYDELLNAQIADARKAKGRRRPEQAVPLWRYLDCSPARRCRNPKSIRIRWSSARSAKKRISTALTSVRSVNSRSAS